MTRVRSFHRPCWPKRSAGAVLVALLLAAPAGLAWADVKVNGFLNDAYPKKKPTCLYSIGFDKDLVKRDAKGNVVKDKNGKPVSQGLEDALRVKRALEEALKHSADMRKKFEEVCRKHGRRVVIAAVRDPKIQNAEANWRSQVPAVLSVNLGHLDAWKDHLYVDLHKQPWSQYREKLPKNVRYAPLSGIHPAVLKKHGYDKVAAQFQKNLLHRTLAHELEHLKNDPKEPKWDPRTHKKGDPVPKLSTSHGDPTPPNSVGANKNTGPAVDDANQVKKDMQSVVGFSDTRQHYRVIHPGGLQTVDYHIDGKLIVLNLVSLSAATGQVNKAPDTKDRDTEKLVDFGAIPAVPCVPVYAQWTVSFDRPEWCQYGNGGLPVYTRPCYQPVAVDRTPHGTPRATNGPSIVLPEGGFPSELAAPRGDDREGPATDEPFRFPDISSTPAFPDPGVSAGGADDDDQPAVTTATVVQLPATKGPPDQRSTVTVKIFVKATRVAQDGSTRETAAPVSNAMLKLSLGQPPPLANTPGAVKTRDQEDDGASDPPIVFKQDAGDEHIYAAVVPFSALPAGRGPSDGPIAELDLTPPESRIIQLDPKNGSDPAAYLPAGLLPYVLDALLLNRSLYVTVQYSKDITQVVASLIQQIPPQYLIRVEINYCRDKAGDAPTDPYFVGRGSWGQTYDDQWGIKRVGFTAGDDSAWTLVDRQATEPVVVAVIDTGLDWNHKDISWKSIWTNQGEIPDNGVDDDGNGYVDDVIGWNFVNQDNKPWDRDGHGTFVTGLMAATRDNGVGIAGINPDARFMVLKALNDFGHTRASYLARALVYAVDNGAKVINLSVGGQNVTTLERDAIEYAHAKGALVVVAAGNGGASIDQYGPASLAHVVTVAATGLRNERASFSNWGAGVDIAAPGVDILSLRARRTDVLYGVAAEYQLGESFVGKDKRYLRSSGTSFAAPMVSATASLIWSLRPGLTNTQVERMIVHSAQDVDFPGVDQFTGYGLLDATAALRADPAFFLVARIGAVGVVQRGGRPFVQVRGTVDADQFGDARIELGQGQEPGSWETVVEEIKKPVRDDVLGEFDAQHLRGARVWTLRVITRHKDGREREQHFVLNLG